MHDLRIRIPGSLIITHFNVAYWSTVYVVKFSTINFVAYSWSVLFFIAIVCTRAESVTENRNRYRDILKNRNWHRPRYWKNRKPTKNTEKTKIRFLLMTIYYSQVYSFFAVNVKKWRCETPLPPVLSLLPCTVLENCRNSSSISRNNECIAHHYCS